MSVIPIVIVAPAMVQCPSCGTPNPKQNKNCANCGASLAAAQPMPAPSQSQQLTWIVALVVAILLLAALVFFLLLNK